jgi:hypothetical protein
VKARWIACAALALSAPLASAQDSSNLMPAEPPVPSGSGGARIYIPGMPLPQPIEAGERAPAVSKSGKNEGPQGLILTDDNSNFEAVEGTGPVNEAGVPESHVVQKGDTLWDLSARYYRNGYGWPKLWSFNPQITNPHWIYPGDLVRLVAPGEPLAAAPTPAPGTGFEPQPRLTTTTRRGGGFTLRQTGFIEEKELAQAGKIVGSKEEKKMLATLDEAYVAFPKDKGLPRNGERFTIYHPTRVVKHPLSGKKLGWMVEILGEGEVRAVTDSGVARIMIIDAINPIWRGYIVGPLRRQFKSVSPRASAADQSGVVVATLRPQMLIGADEVVFMDRGRNDRIEVGNRLLVTRRGDGDQPVLHYGPLDDARFPREDVAEVLVVDVGDQISTGLVTRAVKEAEIGDRVESRRGY